jgi:hypothetical protein
MLTNERSRILDLGSHTYGEIIMKRKILLTLSVVMILGLVIAAYAFQATTAATADTAKASCCKQDGSCPMKAKGHDGQGEHAKMSCPMNHGDQSAMATHAVAGDHSSCECCGDSCPMKKGGASAASATADGASCCDDCDCCKGTTGSAV